MEISYLIKKMIKQFLALSGDFYNYGTTTMTGSINKGIFKFTISGASNHYSPVDFEEYLVIK